MSKISDLPLFVLHNDLKDVPLEGTDKSTSSNITISIEFYQQNEIELGSLYKNISTIQYFNKNGR